MSTKPVHRDNYFSNNHLSALTNACASFTLTTGMLKGQFNAAARAYRYENKHFKSLQSIGDCRIEVNAYIFVESPDNIGFCINQARRR